MRRAAAALLAGAIVGGCGSSGLASPVALRRQASDICRDASPIRPPADPTASAQLTVFLSHGTTNLEGEITPLERLHAPAGEVGAVYAAALRAMKAEAVALRAATASIRRGQDPALAFKTLRQQLTPLERQVDQAWEALQIPACIER